MNGGPVAAASPLQGGRRDRVHGEHVVAVHPDAGKSKTRRPPVQRNAGLTLDRFRNSPLVVLAEEHDRGVVRAGEDESLVDITLTGRAVAEVADHRNVTIWIAGAHEPVALDAHGVARGVQRLSADHDGVEVKSRRYRVPAAKIDASVEGEQMDRVDTAAPGHPVLAIGGKDEVLLAQAPGPDPIWAAS